jgi:2-methylcitrate dehydratase PrpD
MNTHSSLANFFAEKICNTSFHDLPEDAFHWAKMGVLDTVGVTIAGSHEPCALLIAKALDLPHTHSHPNPLLASIWGGKLSCSPADAALINGTAAHALDFDDCNNTLGGHPSAPILPALFALSDVNTISAEDFLTAYILGFEVETKIAMCVNFHHYTKGWHPTATLGTFGAAAACAKLLKLDPKQTATALALAASSAAGIKANFGTMTKPMHVGKSAKEGLMAAKFAQAGYTANTESVFEHHQGFFEVFNGKGFYEPAKAREFWAKPWDIVEPGIAIKQYPCCGSTHPAVDVAIDIHNSPEFNLNNVVQIKAWIHERRLTHTNRPFPKSELDAKFSLQYVIARALLDGKVGIEHFENNIFLEPNIQNLLSKISVSPYDDQMFDPSNHFAARVEVEFKDGKRLTQNIPQPHGRTSANPLSKKQLKNKYELCTKKHLSNQGIELTHDWIENMLNQKNVGSLSTLIQNHLI